MYVISEESSKIVNSELKDMREYQKDIALTIRKVYSNLKKKEWQEEPRDTLDLINAYSGKLGILQIETGCDYLIKWLTFEYIEDIEVPVVHFDDTEEDEVSKEYSSMDASELAEVLFRMMGTEVKKSITAMTTGLKIKLNMLDELKQVLLDSYPNIRIDVLEEKIAKALALVKLDKGSSLAVEDGNLCLYKYLKNDRTIDSSNYVFLAKIGGDKTKTLDALILQSAFRSYKDGLSKGTVKDLGNEFNLSVVHCINGIKPVSKESLEAIKDLF